MAKKDKTDSTPIEFYIPPADLGGKGARVPIPINQPNWRYKLNSTSRYSASIVTKAFLIIAIALSVLLIVSQLYTSPLWIGVIIFGIISFISARSEKILESQNAEKQGTENDENATSPNKKHKKHPKHRKDYK
jgi:hypothetical protein